METTDGIPVIVPRPVRRTGRTGAGWPEGEGPELHDLLYDATVALAEEPEHVNGAWFTAFTVGADRARRALSWARKIAARQPASGFGETLAVAIAATEASLARFPGHRTDTLALIERDGPQAAEAAFRGWWTEARAQVPAIEAAIVEIERTGWGLELEGLYQVHLRVHGRAICLGVGRTLTIVRTLYGRGWVPAHEVVKAVWGRRKVKPSTLRATLVGVNHVLHRDDVQWAWVRTRRGMVELDVVSPPGAR